MTDPSKLEKLMNLFNYAFSKGASDLLGFDAPHICIETGRVLFEEMEKEGAGLVKATPLDTVNAVYGYFLDLGYFSSARAEAGGADGEMILYEKDCLLFESNHRVCAGTRKYSDCLCMSVIRYAVYARFSLEIRIEEVQTDTGAREDRKKATLKPPGPEESCVISLAEKLKNDERELARVSGDFRRAVDMSLDAIVSVDGSGRIILWNPAASEMFGYAREEALRTKAEELIPREYRESHIGALRKFFLTGRAVRLGKVFELVGLRKDGTRFPIEVSLSSDESEDGWVFTAVIRDITERRRLEEELEQRVLELERFNKMMIGRELKMEELRKEIMALRLRAGEKDGR